MQNCWEVWRNHQRSQVSYSDSQGVIDRILRWPQIPTLCNTLIEWFLSYGKGEIIIIMIYWHYIICGFFLAVRRDSKQEKSPAHYLWRRPRGILQERERPLADRYQESKNLSPVATRNRSFPKHSDLGKELQASGELTVLSNALIRPGQTLSRSMSLTPGPWKPWMCCLCWCVALSCGICGDL